MSKSESLRRCVGSWLPVEGSKRLKAFINQLLAAPRKSLSLLVIDYTGSPPSDAKESLGFRLSLSVVKAGKGLFSLTLFCGGFQACRAVTRRDSGRFLGIDFLRSMPHLTVEILLGALYKALLDLEKGPGHCLSPSFLTDEDP